MKYNYPVKYAAMPIIEQVGWSHGLNELDRVYDVVCYIVSKCYLLSDRTKYNQDGKIEKDYEVVLPYQKREYYNWERITPSVNDSTYVEKVFNSYNEALEFVTQKNKELCDKTLAFLPFTKDLKNQISEKTQEFNDRLSKYKKLEQQILANTEQSNVKELNEIILYNKGKSKVVSSNLYEYLNYSTYSKYIVYSISKEQYNKFLTLINNRDLSSISSIIENSIPILYHDFKTNEKNILVINKNGNVLYYINEWGFLISNDKDEIPPIKLNNIDNKTEYVFTTETLEDIIMSFNQYKHEYLKLSDLNEPTLKKTLLK